MTVGRSGGSRKERVFLIVKLLARKQGSARQLSFSQATLKWMFAKFVSCPK